MDMQHDSHESNGNQQNLNEQYQGQSITQSMNQINDQQKRMQSEAFTGGKRGGNVIEDQYNKK